MGDKKETMVEPTSAMVVTTTGLNPSLPLLALLVKAKPRGFNFWVKISVQNKIKGDLVMEYLFLVLIVLAIIWMLVIKPWLKNRKEQKEYKAVHAALAEARKYNILIGFDRMVRVVQGKITTGNPNADANVRRVYQEHLR